MTICSCVPQTINQAAVDPVAFELPIAYLLPVINKRLLSARSCRGNRFYVSKHITVCKQ